MSTSTFSLVVVTEKTLSAPAVMQEGAAPFRTLAQPGVRYLLAQGEKNTGPVKLVAKRNGADLEIGLPDEEQPRLIIKDFYLHPGEVGGLAEDGSYHTYVSTTGESVREAEELNDSESAVLIMSSESSNPGVLVLPEGSALGLLKAGSAFVGLLGLGGIIYSMQNQHSGTDRGIPAPEIINAHAEGSSSADNIRSGGNTNDPTPQLSGKGDTPGNMIEIYNHGVLLGSTVINPDGSWSFTPAALPHGIHSFNAVESNSDGKTSGLSGVFELNVDLIAPDVKLDVVLDDVAGGVVGTIGNDGSGLTNDARPLLKGSAEAGSLVRIYDGTTLIGSAVADAQGAWRWQYSATDNFTDGSHTLSVTATDAVGNTSQPTQGYVITVDTVVAMPTLAIVSDAVAFGAFGDIDNDGRGLTNDPRPLLSGSAEAGSLVRIYDGSTLIGSAVTDAQGAWRWQFAGSDKFSDAVHSLSVTATDPAGNLSGTSDTFVITVDTAIAQPTIATVSDAVAGGAAGDISNDGTGLTNDARPLLSGSAEAGSVVRIYDGSTLIGSAQVNAEGIWSWQYSGSERFSDAQHTLTVTATDAAGNVSVPSDSFVITVDTAIAQPTIATVSDAVAGGAFGDIDNDGTGLTNDPRPLLSGSAEAGSQVRIYDGNTLIGSAVANAEGVWSWQFAGSDKFSDAVHTLSVTATDPAGNLSVASDSFVITVDSTIAQPTIATVSDAVAGGAAGDISNDGTGLTNDARPLLSGSAKPGSLVQIYDGSTPIGSALANAEGVWSWQYADGDKFSDAVHTLTVTATDAAGNVSVPSDSFVITVDSAIAQPTIATVSDAVAGGAFGDIDNDGTGLTNDPRPLLSGSAEAGSLVRIYDGNTLIGSAVADAEGVWSWQFAGSDKFSDAVHTLSVTATDPAGNLSASSAIFVITVDTAMAQPTIATVSDAVAGGVTGDIGNDGTGLTNDARPLLNGSAEAGSLVRIYDGNTLIGSAQVNAEGIWSWQYSGSERFSDAQHTLTVTATDAAGNLSVPSDTFVITVDTAIAQPTIATVSDAVAGGAFGDIASDGTGLTNDARPLLSGNAEAGSVVTIYNGTTAIGSVVANATTGAWSWQYPTGERFDDGRHGLTVIAVDRAGNVSASSGEFIITVDTVPPEVPSIIDGTDNAGAISETIYQNRVTDDATPEFHGTAGPNEWVYIYDNDQLIGTVQANASGEWTLTLPELNPGRHNLSAVSIDAAGNASAPSGTYPFQLGTVWDFNDGTLDGWTLVGKHALPESNELVKTADGGYQLEFNTPGETGYGGNVMTLEFEVEAGKTYDFSFILSRITHYSLISPAQLALTVNGVPVSEYLTVGETPQKVAGSWTATSSGTITLAIHDRVDAGNGNDFWIDNIAIAPGEIAPPIAPISAPIPDEAVVDESIPLLANSYGDDRGASTFAVPVDAILQQSEDDLFPSGENPLLTAGDQAEDKITLADILPQGADIDEWAQVGERTLNEGASPSYEHRSAAVDIDLQQSPYEH